MLEPLKIVIGYYPRREPSSLPGVISILLITIKLAEKATENPDNKKPDDNITY